MRKSLALLARFLFISANYPQGIKEVLFASNGIHDQSFFFDGIDVISSRWYNEYHTILNSSYRESKLVSNIQLFNDYNKSIKLLGLDENT